MTALRRVASEIARAGTHPVLTAERLFAIERIAAELETRRLPSIEPLGTLIARTVSDGTGALTEKELRRLVDGSWRAACPAATVARIVEAVLVQDSRSCDRALIHAYLLHYPIAHTAFEMLRAAAAAAARRHDWAWRASGDRWHLWKRDGPATVATALRGGFPLTEIGFTGALARSLFLTTIEQDKQ